MAENASNDLLITSMNNTIVQAQQAASSNATNQLNASTAAANEALRIHAHNEGMLGKRICELDNAEGMATAEMLSRISTTSQPFHTAATLAQLGGVNQHNQNISVQALAQQLSNLQASVNAILSSK